MIEIPSEAGRLRPWPATESEHNLLVETELLRYILEDTKPINSALRRDDSGSENNNTSDLQRNPTRRA
jgi:hypothetical protein